MDKLREELSCAVRVYIFLVLFSVLTLVDWNTQLCFLSSFFFLYYFFFQLGFNALGTFGRFVWRSALNRVPLLVDTGKRKTQLCRLSL
jgi:hypothetical protein